MYYMPKENANPSIICGIAKISLPEDKEELTGLHSVPCICLIHLIGKNPHKGIPRKPNKISASTEDTFPDATGFGLFEHFRINPYRKNH